MKEFMKKMSMALVAVAMVLTMVLTTGATKVSAADATTKIKVSENAQHTFFSDNTSGEYTVSVTSGSDVISLNSGNSKTANITALKEGKATVKCERKYTIFYVWTKIQTETWDITVEKNPNLVTLTVKYVTADGSTIYVATQDGIKKESNGSISTSFSGSNWRFGKYTISGSYNGSMNVDNRLMGGKHSVTIGKMTSDVEVKVTVSNSKVNGKVSSDHVDVRVDGEIEVGTATDGVSDKNNVTYQIKVTSVTGKVGNETLKFTQQNSSGENEFRATGLNINSDSKVDLTINYDYYLNNQKVGSDSYNHTYTGNELKAAWLTCYKEHTSGTGFDIWVDYADITNNMTSLVTVQYVDENGTELHTASTFRALPGNSKEITIPSIDGYMIKSNGGLTINNGKTTVTTGNDDKTYTVVYTPSQFTVTYKVNGSTVGNVDTVNYGTEVTVRNPYEMTGYTVTGWTSSDVTMKDGRFTMPAKNVVINATATQNEYKVTYVVDGVTYKTVTGKHYGDPIEIIQTPARPGYKVSDWATEDVTSIVNGNFHMPAHDVTFTANSTINQYTVTYKLDGEQVGEVETYNFNTVVTLRDKEEKTGYTVSDWTSKDVTIAEGKITIPAKNVVINATSTVNKYSVTYKVNGETVKSTREATQYGADASTIALTNTAAGYTVPVGQKMTTEWHITEGVNDNAKVEGNVVVEATVSYIDYTVKFDPKNGEDVISNTYHYGDTVVVPADPKKASDNTYDYTFANWTPVVTTVTGDATYEAVYEAHEIKYTITFKFENGANDSVKTYTYGETFEVPGNPVLKTDDIYSHSFQGWEAENGTVSQKRDLAKLTVTGDATYTAKYSNKVVVMFYEFKTPVDQRADFFDQKVIDTQDSSKFAQVGKTVTIMADGDYTAAEQAVIDKLQAIFNGGKIVYNQKASSVYGTNQADKISGVIESAAPMAGANVADAVDEWYVIKLEGNGWHIDGGNYNDYTVTYEYDMNDAATAEIVREKNVAVEIQKTEGLHVGQATPAVTKPEFSDATYTYTVNMPEVSETVTGNTTYKVTVSREYIDYTITFKFANGKNDSVKTYHYGEKFVVPANPSYGIQDIYTHTFTGWLTENGTVTNKASLEKLTVTGNAVYVAQYSVKANVYFFKFKNIVDQRSDFYDQQIIEGQKTSDFVQVGKIVIDADGTYTAEEQKLLDLLQVVYNSGKIKYDQRTSSKYGSNVAKTIYEVAEVAAPMAGEGVLEAVNEWYVLKLESDGWHFDGGNYNGYKISYIVNQEKCYATGTWQDVHESTEEAFFNASAKMNDTITVKEFVPAQYYTVTDWTMTYTDKDGVEHSTTIKAGETFSMPNADVTLTADCTRVKCNITAEFDNEAADEAIIGRTQTVCLGDKFSIRFFANKGYDITSVDVLDADNNVVNTITSWNTDMLKKYTGTAANIYSQKATGDLKYVAHVQAHEYTLTINYVDEKGNVLADAYTNKVAYLADYSVDSAVVTGYTPDQATVTGTMPAEDVTVNVVYSINSHKLTIKYVFEDGTTAADTYENTLNFNDDYSVTSPEVTGYSTEDLKVEGTMGDADVELTVVYTINQYNLTIHYVYEDGTAAFDDYTDVLDYNVEYSVESPYLEDYTVSQEVVENVMPAGDVEVTVTYVEHGKNTLTINYFFHDENGATAAPSVVFTNYIGKVAGEEVVETPEIVGYTADIASVDASEYTIGEEALVVNVVYTLNSYTVTYIVDGTTVDTTSANYGDAVAALLEKVYTAAEGYTFSGWSTEFEGEVVTEDITIVGSTKLAEVEADEDEIPEETEAETEEETEEETKKNSEVEADSDVVTADHTNTGLLIALLSVSALGLVTLFLKRRSDKKHNA